MKTPRWLPRPAVHHHLARLGLSRALVAWPPAAPNQEPCAFVMEESPLEVVVAVAARAVAVVEGPEVVEKAVGAESGEDRRGSE